jgi:CRP/FNR family transcriptional regulator, cyclic AMP receptor protein
VEGKRTKKTNAIRKTAKPAQALKFSVKSILSTIGSGQVTRKYRPKKVVFQQGGPADAVFFIQSGKVELLVLSEQGKEGVVTILGAGDFFGEGCLVGQPMRMASAIALMESTIVRIEKHAMIRLLHDKPAFSEMFMAYLLMRNVQFEADVVDRLFNSSERRLARVLLLLANIGKEGRLEAIVPGVSQGILAARVGTTRSRINFFMNKFRKLGFIEYDGGMGGLKVHSGLLSVIVQDLSFAP